MNFHGSRFVIGVTGHMMISAADAEKARQSVEALLQWLTADPQMPQEVTWQKELGAPLGLPASCVLVMTSLAPGVDQIAAEVCLSRGIEILCPLPFPHSWRGTSTDPGAPVFRNSTSFVLGDDEDSVRQKKYDEFTATVGEQRLFAVKRLCDSGLSEDELEARLKADLADPAQRDLRYRAAGEFIASNCDILLAICDRLEWHPILPVSPGASPETQPGSNFVVESRLRGATPGLLPDKSSLTWADNGPVIRVYIQNQRRVEESPTRQIGNEVWHPEDSAPGYLESHHWDRYEMSQLRLFATQIGRVHQLYSRAADIQADKVEDEFLPSSKARLFIPTTFSRCSLTWIQSRVVDLKSCFRKQSHPQMTETPTQTAVVESRLQQIARIYEGTSQIADDADRQVKKLRRGYLWAAGAAVVMMQMAEQFGPEAGDGPAHGWLTAMRWIFVVLAVGMIGEAFRRHFVARRKQTESTQNEFRALAEALRIQFYWSAAGTGQLVSQHYLQRQRSDLSWIRAAVGAMLIPADRDEQDFHTLSTEEKIQRLEKIHRGWIGGQRVYFEKTAWRLGNRKHWLHFWKTVFMSAGLSLMAAGIAVHLSHKEDLFEGLSAHWGFWAPLHVLGVFLTVFFAVQLIAAYAWQKLKSDLSTAEGSGSENSLAVQVMRTDETQRWMKINDTVHHIISSQFIAIPAGILIAMAIVGNAFCGQVPESWFAAPVKLVIFWRNIFLTIAALIHAASAFSFLAQNVPRYQTMRGLYQGADYRWLLIHNLMTRKDATPEQVQQAIRHAQNLFIDLGIESLSENSEWLLMHRVTPTNPLIPAG